MCLRLFLLLNLISSDDLISEPTSQANKKRSVRFMSVIVKVSLRQKFRNQVLETDCDAICEERLVDCLFACDINDNSCYRDCLRHQIQCLEGVSDPLVPSGTI